MTIELMERADEGVKLWQELLEIADIRLVMDGLPFMNEDQFKSTLDQLHESTTSKSGSRVNATSGHLDVV